MWKETIQNKLVTKVVADVKINYEMLKDNPNKDLIIKEQIAQMLVQEIMKSDLLTIIKEHDMENFGYRYQGRLYIAEPGVSNVLLSNYNYEVKDILFSHKQIEKAILNTFPEMYL